MAHLALGSRWSRQAACNGGRISSGGGSGEIVRAARSVHKTEGIPKLASQPGLLASAAQPETRHDCKRKSLRKRFEGEGRLCGLASALRLNPERLIWPPRRGSRGWGLGQAIKSGAGCDPPTPGGILKQAWGGGGDGRDGNPNPRGRRRVPWDLLLRSDSETAVQNNSCGRY